MSENTGFRKAFSQRCLVWLTVCNNLTVDGFSSPFKKDIYKHVTYNSRHKSRPLETRGLDVLEDVSYSFHLDLLQFGVDTNKAASPPDSVTVEVSTLHELARSTNP